MRRILKHAVVGLGVSALTAVAVVGNFGHSDAASGSTPAIYVETSAAPSTAASAGPTSNPAEDAVTARVNSSYGVFRSDVSRPVPSGGMNVARDARQLALATQAQLVSTEQLRILQERQLAAAQKSVADEAARSAKQSKLLAAQAAAQARQMAAAEQQAQARQQQSADQAAAATQQPTTTDNTQTYDSSDPHEIARQMMQQNYGWGSDQYSCLNNIVEHESNWKVDATNPNGGAYGIPQSLPGYKMASAGADWRTNPATQLKWMLGYVKSRYGTPCGAWGYWQAHRNY